MSPQFLRTLGHDIIRASLYSVIIILFLIGATFLLGNQQVRQTEYLTAIACELALAPEDRTPAAVSLCFRNEGLAPPSFVLP